MAIDQKCFRLLDWYVLIDTLWVIVDLDPQIWEYNIAVGGGVFFWKSLPLSNSELQSRMNIQFVSDISYEHTEHVIIIKFNLNNTFHASLSSLWLVSNAPGLLFSDNSDKIHPGNETQCQPYSSILFDFILILDSRPTYF